MSLDQVLQRVGITQRELAQEVGVREEAVSRWVNEHHTPDGRNMLAVLTAIQRRDPSVTFEQLFGAALPPAANE